MQTSHIGFRQDYKDFMRESCSAKDFDFFVSFSTSSVSFSLSRIVFYTTKVVVFISTKHISLGSNGRRQVFKHDGKPEEITHRDRNEDNFVTLYLKTKHDKMNPVVRVFIIPYAVENFTIYAGQVIKNDKKDTEGEIIS